MEKILVSKISGERYSAYFEGSLISIHGRSAAEAIGNLMTTFAQVKGIPLDLTEDAKKNLDEHQHHHEYSEA